jgi:peptidoglycan L-alanyl-D-glutamate endopeptidase CwlK
MTHVLGQNSLKNLDRVHPDLKRIIVRAIGISEQDFGITEPQVRTLEYQRTLVARGVSKTLKSNHLEQEDLTHRTKELLGHAVDLVPWNGTAFVWDWDKIYPIAVAMAQAAEAEKLRDKLCWGGVWDRWMSQYDCSSPALVRKAEATYCVRHPGKDFVDGPHFQLYKMG